MKPLQEFSFRDSHYDRPNQDWVCGRAVEGDPCWIGPDGKGRCRASFECRPARQEERWLCARSDFAGGRCEQGPLPDGTCCRALTPCQPKRSSRANRRWITRIVAGLTFGLLLFVLSGSMGPRLIDPGDVTFQHAQLGSCADCHAAFDAPMTRWPALAFTNGAGSNDSAKCAACHEFGANALAPHSLARATLDTLTRSVQPANAESMPFSAKVSGAVLGPPPGMDNPVACGSCHKEHQGQGFDLAAISNTRCTGCHAKAFESLANGHPEFGAYPFERRTRLIFDHGSHFETHFIKNDFKKRAPKQCAGCHAPDTRGRTMVVLGYDAICRDCHGAQIAGVSRASSKGVAVLTVPGLDIHGLVDSEIPVGEWPEHAEEPITPFMELLLSGDPDYVKARDGLADVDLLDLSDADPETLERVKVYAWRVKALFFDLTTGGTPSLRARLDAALEQSLDLASVARLSGALSQDAVLAAQASWFPNLLSEVSRFRAGETIAASEVDEEHETDEDEAREEACHRADRAGGEEIDCAELEAAEHENDEAEEKGGGLLAGEDEAEENEDGDLLAESEEDDDNEESSESLLAKEDDQSDGLLAEKDDEDDGLLAREEEADEEEEGESGLLDESEDKEDGGLLEGEEDDEEDHDRRVETAELAPAAEIMAGEAWAEHGGWYRDDFTLRYRPSGHADMFLTQWLSLTGATPGTKSGPFAGAVFEALARRDAPGICAKCHSVDHIGDGAMAVNWTGSRSDPRTQAFTRFSHAAHFNQLNDEGCLSCHARDPDAKSASGYQDRDPKTHAGNFKSVARSTCAECHTASGAGEQCVSCHDYHVGTFPAAMTKTMVVTKH
jgi:hypothetical protein